MTDSPVERADQAAKGSPFLSPKQAAFYLGMSLRTLQAHRSAGTGPAYRRHSQRISYHIDDLDAWSKASAAGRD